MQWNMTPLLAMPRTGVMIVDGSRRRIGGSWPWSSFTMYDWGIMARAMWRTVQFSYAEIYSAHAGFLDVTIYFVTGARVVVSSTRAKQITAILMSKGVMMS